MVDGFPVVITTSCQSASVPLRSPDTRRLALCTELFGSTLPFEIVLAHAARGSASLFVLKIPPQLRVRPRGVGTSQDACWIQRDGVPPQHHNVRAGGHALLTN
jgi:hypothetical protein